MPELGLENALRICGLIGPVARIRPHRPVAHAPERMVTPGEEVRGVKIS